MSEFVIKSTHDPLKRKICDSLSPVSHSATISAGFHSQKSQGLLLLALEPWAGELSVRLGPLAPQGGHPQPRFFSQFSAASCECETSLFRISASPTSLEVASSVCPQL